MSTERPAVPSRLPRLWKSYHPVPAGFSHIFPLLLPAPQLKPQLCKLHDPGAVTPKSFPARGWWPKVMIHGQAGTAEVMHASLWEPFSEAELWLTFASSASPGRLAVSVHTQWAPDLSPLPWSRRGAVTWVSSTRGWEVSLLRECHSTLSLPVPASARAQSNFCANWNDEQMENVWEKPRGLNRAQAFMSNSQLSSGTKARILRLHLTAASSFYLQAPNTAPQTARCLQQFKQEPKCGAIER